MKAKLKILVTDDHKIFINGLIENLKKINPQYTIFSANNGQQAIKIIKNQSIDIVILDINMPVLNGIDTTYYLSKNYPHIKIIILTAFGDINYIMPIHNMDIKIIIEKNSTNKKVLEKAINAAINNKTFYTRYIKKTIEEIATKKTSKPQSANPKLTKREKQVLVLLSEGLSNKQIAKKLHLKTQTIKTYRKSIYFKLEVHNIAQLLKKALKYELIK